MNEPGSYLLLALPSDPLSVFYIKILILTYVLATMYWYLGDN